MRINRSFGLMAAAPLAAVMSVRAEIRPASTPSKKPRHRRKEGDGDRSKKEFMLKGVRP